MKKWLTYLFLLNAYLGYSQPSSWKRNPTSDSITWLFTPYLEVGSTSFPYKIGDAIAVFSKNPTNTYECVGFTKVNASDSMVTLRLYARGAKDSHGFITGQAYYVNYWNSGTSCYQRLPSRYFPDSLKSNASNLSIPSIYYTSLSIGYPKATYLKTEANPRIIIGDTTLVDSIRYSCDNPKLSLNPINGQVNLAASDTGTYIIRLLTANCLLDNLRQLRIEDTTKPKDMLGQLKYEVIPPTCTKGGELHVQASSIKGTPPYFYRLVNTSTNKEFTSSVAHFADLPEGMYHLEVTDSTNTTEIYHQPIPLIRSEDCSNPVLAPESKNGLETVYIEAQGTAKILDREGKVVKEMSIPNNWDGSDNTGKALPMGDYYLFVNGSQSKVITIIR